MLLSDGFPKKSGVLVTFTDLAFHVRSYGDLTDDELEEVVSFLTERIQTQERTELGQLDRLQKTLHRQEFNFSLCVCIYICVCVCVCVCVCYTIYTHGSTPSHKHQPTT